MGCHRVWMPDRGNLEGCCLRKRLLHHQQQAGDWPSRWSARLQIKGTLPSFKKHKNLSTHNTRWTHTCTQKHKYFSFHLALLTKRAASTSSAKRVRQNIEVGISPESRLAYNNAQLIFLVQVKGAGDISATATKVARARCLRVVTLHKFGLKRKKININYQNYVVFFFFGKNEKE